MWEAERAKAEAGEPSLVEPLDPGLERDLLCLQVAEVLRTPAWLVPRLPLRWVEAALTLLEARAAIAEQGPGGADSDEGQGGGPWR